MTDRPALTVVTDDPTPPYEQLRRQFVELIRYGVLAPDDRLPPLRQLAADLGLAVGTVARTYRELEAAGMVVSRRGGGTRVAALPPPGANPAETLRERAATFVREARLLGADDDQIASAVARALDR
ncbi:Histidine utilization repressor [Actinoplanes sp. SE50]|uniref:GntR family transcriptional regulator n=1 Tax=unclassified Actinoplanes TaxID=2626549 RepID=UPI00023EC2B1|nr:MULTISPECIES: GntR family transcriptional regulator [unclassified Actinoplanes]AEV84625.1 Histidine utilization repressor [Actinoplanes sp. SE50/110]ATO83017.1 Histidine utilization repressor [Actinoplanes sp. SE50]SLM00425.1 GntR family transcriptional regulator [Actinoplanes sp. SE50/110]